MTMMANSSFCSFVLLLLLTVPPLSEGFGLNFPQNNNLHIAKNGLSIVSNIIILNNNYRRRQQLCRSKLSLSSRDNNNNNVENPSTVMKMTSTEGKEENDETTLWLFRKVERMEKFARLPVWPAWNGVFLFIVSRLLGEEVAAKLEDQIGGRVCPNFFSPSTTTSPFIMLVHHRHSFAGWDILRYIQSKFILPEGFPAHAHRGFITVTYCLKGGMRHRDSMGVQQSYGAENHHNHKHTQWLSTGSGLLHEEMWDIPSQNNNNNNNILHNSHQELYQLWLNVPRSDKMNPPQIYLLGGNEDNITPTITDKSTSTLVIYGQHKGKIACQNNNHSTNNTNHDDNAEDDDCSLNKYQDKVNIFHVKMDAQSKWDHTFPSSSPHHDTVIIYVRQGSIQIGNDVIPTHNTAYLSKSPSTATDIRVLSSQEGADFLFLSGVDLREPVEAQGSMVMTTPNEINEAYADYQMGKMGIPWSEKLSDEEWEKHIILQNTKSFRTNYSNKPETTEKNKQ